MIHRTNRLPLLLLLAPLLLLPFSGAGCGGGGTAPQFQDVPGDVFVDVPQDRPPPEPDPEPPPPAPTPPGSTTNQPRVPLGATPPIGLTWQIGYTENTAASQLQQIYGKVVALNTALWNVTEGQVYIYHAVITDNVGPGTTPQGWLGNTNSITTSNLDILVWPPNKWDLGGTAGLCVWSSPPQFGRTGLLMLLPLDANTHTWLHEAGHLIWNLSWSVSFGLEDEYIDGIQDLACVMESTNPPQRWCSSANHVNQSCQPHSCWTQILIDYGKFTHNDNDMAGSAPWKPKVTYNDAP